MLGLIGAGIGAAAGSFRQASQEAHERDMVKMQYEYNNKMAIENQKRNKEMWDYTNYENQRKHIENAGLNPALLYGMSGGGGASTGGGAGSGVGLPPMKGGDQAQAATAMGLQAGMSLSQIKLNESQAKKNEAEAEKIAGVDTKAQEATIENLIAVTSNEKVKKGLIYADTRLKDAQEELTRGKVDETSWNVKNLIKSVDMADKMIEGAGLDNELKSRTMENNVRQAEEALRNTMADTIVKYSQNSVNKEQAKAIAENVTQRWAEIANDTSRKEQGWRELELEAEKIMNDLVIGKSNIDMKGKELTKDYILGIGQLLIQAADKFGNVKNVVKGFGR